MRKIQHGLQQYVLDTKHGKQDIRKWMKKKLPTPRTRSILIVNNCDTENWFKKFQDIQRNLH